MAKENESKAVKIPFYNELKRAKEVTGMDMSVLLEKAWANFKTTKYYAIIMLGINIKRKGE